MDEPSTLAVLRRLLADQFRIPASDVSPEDSVSSLARRARRPGRTMPPRDDGPIGDLTEDSLDFVEFMIRLEETLDVAIPDEAVEAVLRKDWTVAELAAFLEHYRRR